MRKAPVDWAKTIEEFREEARKRNRLLESTITDHRATKRLLSDVAARTHNLDTRLGELADILNNHDDWRAYHDGRFDGHDRQIQYLGVTMEQVVALLDKLGIEINTGMVTDQEFNDRLAHLEAVVSALQHTQPQPIIRQACATSVTAETTPFPWFKVLATASVLGAIGSIFAIHFF